jgi:hypothetical protein
MRSTIVVVWMLLGTCASAAAQVSIGINLSVYPDLIQVPGYPVYYAPQLDSNFFFYDGLYWVYAEDGWYASSWYNGPWDMVAPEEVPLFVLRVPVGYYRRQPSYFREWSPEAPPHWGEHWGRDWEQHRGGWDQWNHASAPAPAPLPTYQRGYSGDRYPGVDQQSALRNRSYHYQPRDAVVRQQYQQPPGRAVPERRQARTESDPRNTPPPDTRHQRAPAAAEGAVAPERPESRQPPGGQAADATHRPQAEGRRPPQPGNPGVEQGKEQGALPRESQPSHSRERNDKPSASVPAPDPRRDPDPRRNPGHDRDH